MRKQYQHIFFDLDHTLWDFEANAKDAMQEAYSNNDLQNKGIGDFEAFYERYSYHNRRLWDRYTKGFIKQSDLKWKRMWLSMLDFKIANEPLAKQLSEDFLHYLPLRKSVFPYTFEILHYLKNKKYRLYLITNGFTETQQKKLANAGLTDFFEQMITSESSGSLKPNREIFEYALAQTKADLTQSIMIGDNLDADINGALAFGMDTVFTNHIRSNAPHNATYEVKHLKELEGIL